MNDIVAISPHPQMHKSREDCSSATSAEHKNETAVGEGIVNQCLDCKKPMTRYEVKIKTQVKEYYQFWPCYDERMGR